MTTPPDTGDALKALLPCPFCGGEASGYPHFEDQGSSPGCYITCHKCDCSPDGCYRKAEEWPQAVAVWNTRTPPPSLDEVEALRHDLDRARATANELAAENGQLIEALGELHRACMGRPVGGGDGGTYEVGTPSPATLNKANALLTRIKERQ